MYSILSRNIVQLKFEHHMLSPLPSLLKCAKQMKQKKDRIKKMANNKIRRVKNDKKFGYNKGFPRVRMNQQKSKRLKYSGNIVQIMKYR